MCVAVSYSNFISQLKLFSEERGSSKAEKMSKFTYDLEYLMASTDFYEKVVHGKKAKIARETSRILENCFPFFLAKQKIT